MPRAKTSRPAKRSPAKRKSTKPAIAFRLTGEARQMAALARARRRSRSAGRSPGRCAAIRAAACSIVRLTGIADRIAGKPRALRDDLLTLAMAARYAAGPRETLMKAILRAGGINPQSPYLRVGPRR